MTTDKTSIALDSSAHPLTRAKAALAMVPAGAKQAARLVTLATLALVIGWYGMGAMLAAAPADTYTTSARASVLA